MAEFMSCLRRVIVGPTAFLMVSAAAARGDIIVGLDDARGGLDLAAGVTSAAARKAIDAAVDAFKKGDGNTAIKELKAAVEAQPDLPPAPVLFARLAVASGRAPLAKTVLEQAAVEFADRPEVYLQFAVLALAEGRTTDADSHYARAVALLEDPGKALPEASRKNCRIEALLGLATCAERRQQWERARSELTDLLALQPKNGPVRERLGRALFWLGRQEEATKELRQAEKDDPNLAAPEIMMARLFTLKKDTAKAREWIDQALGSAPKDAKVQLAASAWFLEQDQTDLARRHAEAAGQLDPENLDLKKLRGLIARASGTPEAAEPIFSALHQASPADLWASNQLALALCEQKGADAKRRGLELAQLNARQYSNNVEVLTTLAWALIQSDRISEAEQVLLPIGRATSQVSADTAFVLARLLSARGRDEEAIKLLRSAVESTGLFIHRGQAHALLRELAPAGAPTP